MHFKPGAEAHEPAIVRSEPRLMTYDVAPLGSPRQVAPDEPANLRVLASLAMLDVALWLALLGSVGPNGGARPAECNVLPGEHGANVWERAKIPDLRRYCDLVASASAKLTPGSRMVLDVVRLSDEAEAIVPGRPAPMLLKGRALADLDRFAEARVALDAAKSRDARALDDPTALLAWARTLAFTGDAAGAREAYRALLPRADVLPLADRGVAYLGAGMLAMSTGPAGLAEAIAIFRQARRDSQDLLRAAATLCLVLALDRAGEAGESAAVLAEEGAREAASVMQDARVLHAMGKTGATEARAVLALALEAGGMRDAARAAWLGYIAGGPSGSPWEAHARSHAGGHAQPASAGRHALDTGRHP